MSNLLNSALGGLTGAMSGSPLQSLIGSPIQGLTGPLTQSGAGGLTGLRSRDGQMPELGNISSAVNLLQQAANSLGSSNGSNAGALDLSLPPLPPMPPPAKPAAVATDDHGQSNIVFSDADTDGSLIH